MSSWLKKRVLMWCALAVLLGGAQWFSSVWAQSEIVPPAKSPTAAAANFLTLLSMLSTDIPAGSYVNEATDRSLEQTLSRVQWQKIQRFDATSVHLEKLFSEMAQMQSNRQFTGKVTEEDTNKVVVELQKNESSVLCVAEDGGWRVDFFGTYAKWKGLSGLDRDLLIAKLTGEISPLLAQDPERMRVFNGVQENARRANCLSNLQQISLGILQYTQDHDEMMPPAREWTKAIQPHVTSTQIFRCPSVTDPKGFGYALNSRLSHKNINFVDKNTNVAQMVMIYETTDLSWNAYGLGEKPAFRHLGGANYLFLDGHVKWQDKTRIPQFTFGTKK